MIRTGQSRDIRRYEKLMQIGCICCHIDGRYSQGDVHHLTDKGNRRASGGNASTVILCPWHHRSVVPDGHSMSYMRTMYGPSMALERREFEKVYGSQRSLLARVNEMLAGKEAK